MKKILKDYFSLYQIILGITFFIGLLFILRSGWGIEQAYLIGITLVYVAAAFLGVRVHRSKRIILFITQFIWWIWLVWLYIIAIFLGYRQITPSSLLREINTLMMVAASNYILCSILILIVKSNYRKTSYSVLFSISLILIALSWIWIPDLDFDRRLLFTSISLFCFFVPSVTLWNYFKGRAKITELWLSLVGTIVPLHISLLILPHNLLESFDIFFSYDTFEIAPLVELSALFFYLLYVGFDKFILTYWRRTLVVPLDQQAEAQSISIYPDPKLYEDIQGWSGWMNDYINKSNGGVIGITGVRGAGKSALINKTLHSLSDKFFTINISAPVHTESRMEFFMMVCREVCSKVISDVREKILKTSDNINQLSRSQFFNNIKLILVILLIVGLLVYLLYSTQFIKSNQQTSSSIFNFSDFIQSNNIPDDFILDYGNVVIGIDVSAVWLLHSEIEKFLKDDSNSFGCVSISPSSSGWFLLNKYVDCAGQSPSLNLSFLKDRLTEGYSDSLYPKLELTNFAYQQDVNNPTSCKLISEIWALCLFRNINSIFYSNKSDFDFPFSIKYANEWISTCKYWEDFKPHCSEESDNYLNQITRFFNVGFNNTCDDSLKCPKLISYVIIEAFLRYSVQHNEQELLIDAKTELPKLHSLLGAYLNSILPDKINGKSLDKSNLNVQAKSFNVTASETFFNFLSDPITLVLLAFLFLIVFSNYITAALDKFMASLVNYQKIGLLRQSQNFLTFLNYSQNMESSGSLSPASWFSFSSSRSKTEREITLPSITNYYIKFIGEAAPFFNEKMIICIDELDKIDDLETVKKILREIKGALFVPNTYYLISISEDAANAFQSRLAAGRDIFESTFDEVVFINKLNSEQAWKIIKARLKNKKNNSGSQGINDEQEETRRMKRNAAAISLFGGGIPREIIRNFSEVMRNNVSFASPKPSVICWNLLRKKVELTLNDIARVSIESKESLDLYNFIRNAHSILANEENISIDNILRILTLVEKALDLLNIEADKISLKENLEAHASVLDELKQFTELLILGEVTKYVIELKPEQDFEEAFSNRIYAAIAIVDQNPALARHILYETKDIDFKMGETLKA